MALKSVVTRFLAHPLRRNDLPLDSSEMIDIQRQIILSKPFLRAIYNNWYTLISAGLPLIDGEILELGSGGGFYNLRIPNLITSDVIPSKNIQVTVDARWIPFSSSSLKAIVFTNVLHHIPNVREFFWEASRCLNSGGKILMVEPWVTNWSRFIFKTFHHEPFLPESGDWYVRYTGPLSGANGALPWIIFERDRKIFELEFPELIIEKVQPIMPFRYLVSGGVGLRSLVPDFTYPFWKYLDQMCEPRMAMFAFISLRRD